MTIETQEVKEVAKAQRSDSIASLVGALAKAQTEFLPIKKNRTASVITKSGARYEYKYADLGNVIDATRPALSKNGIVILQFPEVDMAKKELTVRTVIAHSSGEWQESILTLPATMRDAFDAQSIGSAYTYARRYQWQGMIGVVSELDDDATRAVGGTGSKEAQQAVKEKALKESGAVPCMFYIWYDKTQNARISGSPELMDRAYKLWHPFWDAKVGAPMVNGDQLEGLKFEFEKLGIPFKPLKAK